MKYNEPTQYVEDYTFDELVTKYWIAMTSEYFSMASLIKKELESRGSRLVNHKWIDDNGAIS